MKPVALIPLLAFALLGCLNGDPIVEPPQENPPVENPDESPAASLRGVTWVLVSVERPGEAPVSVEGHEYTVRFDTAGYVGGRVACNAWGGSYTVTDSVMTGGGNIWTTLVGCEAPYGKEMLGFLGTEPTDYRIQNDTLCMTHDEIRTCFVKEAPPAIPPGSPAPINVGLACSGTMPCLFSDAVDTSLLSVEKRTWYQTRKPMEYETRARLARVNRRLIFEPSMILNLFPDVRPRIYATSIRRLPPATALGDSTLWWSGIMEGNAGSSVSLRLTASDPIAGYLSVDARLAGWHYSIWPVENDIVLITETDLSRMPPINEGECFVYKDGAVACR